MRARKILGLGLLALLFAVPSAADDPGKAKQYGKIYLGHGQILDTTVPRQLSFQANVSQFEYQPGGDAIAFSGVQLNGDTLTFFASLAGTQHGTITKLVSMTKTLAQESQDEGHHGSISAEDIVKEEADFKNPQMWSEFAQYQTELKLNGWSADGKYLLIAQMQHTPVPTPDPNEPTADATSIRYTCVDMSTSPPTQREVSLPITLQPGMFWITSESWWSPKKTKILFEQAYLPDAKPGTQIQRLCTLYDPATRHMTSFVPPPKATTLGWLDESHVLFDCVGDKGMEYFSADAATGQDIEIPKPEKFIQNLIQSVNPPKLVQKISPTNPSLVLEEQSVTFPDAQQVATMSPQALWVRRVQGPKPFSALPISVGLDPGAGEEWSPSGRQVAYLMHGDLFVTDLILRDPTVFEKLALGLDLTCEEQKQIGVSNLKQIALALLQYALDHNDHYPPAGDVSSYLSPYLTGTSVYGLGSSKFIYHGSGQSADSMEAPASFVLGTLDTPCAHIVAYADGHVKTFDRPENGQSGAALGPCSNFAPSKMKHGTLPAATFQEVSP